MSNELRCVICDKEVVIDSIQSAHPDGPQWIKTTGDVRVGFVNLPDDPSAVVMVALCSQQCFEREQHEAAANADAGLVVDATATEEEPHMLGLLRRFILSRDSERAFFCPVCESFSDNASENHASDCWIAAWLRNEPLPGPQTTKN